MADNGLVIYSLQVINTETGEVLTPSVASNGKNTLLEAVWTKLNELKAARFDNGFDRKLSIRQYPKGIHQLNQDASSIYGYMNYGHYGDASDIYDENEVLALKKTKNHSDNRPMFFDFFIKRSKEAPYIILQTYKTMGVKTLVSQFFTQKIKQSFPNLHIELVPYWPAEVKDKIYSSKNIEYIKVVSRKAFGDVADMPITGNADTKFVVEKTYKVLKGRKSKNAEKKIETGIGLKNQEIDMHSFTDDKDVTSVTIGLGEGKKTRGVKMGSGFGRAPSFEVTFKSNQFDKQFFPLMEAFKEKTDALKARYNL